MPLHKRPFKLVYIALDSAVTVCLRFPVWLLQSSTRRLRPRHSWSLKRVFGVQLIAHYLEVIDSLGPEEPSDSTPNHRRIFPVAGIHLPVLIPPCPDSLLLDELRIWMSISEVVPEKIPGYWIYSDDVKQGKKRDSKAGLPVYPPKQGEKVILSFHGGSYVGGTAHPNDFVSTIVKNILRHTHRSAAPTSQQQQEAKPYAERALCVEYRLSSGAPLQPSNPFPAALLDAIAAYHYLIHTVGFSPSDIIVEGDSAGGNLAIALTRYLVEKQIELAEEGLKPPGALLLLSPWADIGSSHDVEVPKSWLARWFASFQLKADYDPPPHGMDYAKCAFVGPYGMGGASTNRYISPGSISPFAHVNFLPPGQSPYAVTVESNSSKDLAEWPRVFLSAGGTENLLPQIHVLRNRMFRDLGEDRSAQANTDPTNVNGNTRLTPSTGKVRYMEAPDVPHDFLLFPWMDPERTETLEAIGSWVRDL